MAFDVNGMSELADFSPTLVAMEALDEMRDATQNAFIQNSLDSSDELVGAGSVTTPIYPAIDFEDETEGTPLEGAQFPADNVVLTPDRKKAVIIPITDYARAVSNQDLMNGYGRQAGRAAMKLIDGIVAGIYSETSHSPVDAGVADIDEADILAGKELLDGANAPATGRVLILHHTQYNAMLAIDNFTRFDAVGLAAGANPKVNGVIGTVHGFTVFLCQNVISASSRRHNVMTVFGGQKDNSAIQWGMSTFRPMVSNTLSAGNRLRLVWTYDTTRASEILRAEMQFDYIALRPEWIVDIQTQTT